MTTAHRQTSPAATRPHSDGRRLAEAAQCSRTTALHFIRGGASKSASQRARLVETATRLGIVVDPPRGAARYAIAPRPSRSRPTATARRAAQVALVAERGLTPWATVIADLAVDEQKDHVDLLALLKAKRLFGRRINGVYMVTTDAALLPPLDLMLPMLQAGPGERRDCRREAECLGRFVLYGGKAANGACHCPPGCTQYAAVESHERVGAATLGGVSALGAAQDVIAESEMGGDENE